MAKKFEHRIDSGSVFPVENKDSETGRDYNGDAKLACPHCNNVFLVWISGWVNDFTGGKYLGLRFKAKDDQPKESRTPPTDLGLQSAPVVQRKQDSAADLDDDIPF